MPRTIISALILLLVASPAIAQPKADPPKLFPPDAATLKQIEAKTAELRKAVEALPRDGKPGLIEDVEIYAKAAEWIVRHGEWFHKDSGKQTLAVLDAGLERAGVAAQGKAPWRDVRGRPVIRGYRSTVDQSVQPYSVTIPEGHVAAGRPWRLDIVLHGRDQTLTEVKFIHSREAAKPPAKSSDYIVLEPYGRGNNAYRWAGEADVLEAVDRFEGEQRAGVLPTDPRRVVLRGFSMGGAGSWHLGLHHPFRFAVIGPGAGFTTTRGYVKNLPPRLSDYQEACLHIYDAVDYAENVANVPVVAYSGEKDPQKAAADTIEAALKGLAEPVRFTHLVAPGLEHRMPSEWQAKADAEYRRHIPRGTAERVRFVTYTARYGHAEFLSIEGLDRHYQKAVVDARWTEAGLEVTTANVRVLRVFRGGPLELLVKPTADRDRKLVGLRIDGQRMPWPKGEASAAPLPSFIVAKEAGRWKQIDGLKRRDQLKERPEKEPGLQGPIDDAFMDNFTVVGPEGDGWHPAATRHAAASLTRFGREWDKYFRGRLPTRPAGRVTAEVLKSDHLVLFGDPGSNPLIAKLVGKLPITWTKDKLVVNGVEYDPKSHVPVLICPNPLNPKKYVVINSGHTFHEADFKGTNALLYPRLGDWAVLKPTPTAKDPAAAEVLAAGLFDEFWRFPATAADK